jgi:alanine dehydrogenase
MRIGILREQHDQEYRVSCLPDGVAALTLAGHEVLVETGAGDGAGVGDAQSAAAGAVLADADEVRADAELVLTVKVPVAAEFPQALTHATLPYVERIAAAGWIASARGDSALTRGANAADGAVTCLPGAQAKGVQTADLRELQAA